MSRLDSNSTRTGASSVEYLHPWESAIGRWRLLFSSAVAIAMAAGGVALGYVAGGIAGRVGAGRSGWTDTLTLWEVLISLVLCLGSYEVYKRAPKRLRWLGVVMSVAASMRYVTWRMTHTLNFDTTANTIACGLLLAAEMYALLMLGLGHFQTFWPTQRRTPMMPPDAKWPSVDVYITTYNEDVDLVRKTAVGCQAIDYPRKKVFILDDGRRPEMRKLADEVGVGYICRDDNRHAKAGNLNHALEQTSGELIAQFDADHVPVRSFLRETVPFFLWDARLAFVQTPHHFYNLDAFQRNLLVKQKIANEQDLFFHVIQPGNDRWNAAFFCGSNAVLRREALASVGGFATETITEDAHTALRMHAKKWNSVYLDRNLAGGLAAESFSDLFSQRIRWGMGMCRILRVDNPLVLGGLKWAQRVCYYTAATFFFYGFPRQIYFLAPVTFMLAGVSPIEADVIGVLAYFLPHWLGAMLLTGAVSRNVRHTFWSEVFETAMAFPMSFATVWSMITRKRMPFKVTPKNTQAQRVRFHYFASLPQMILLVATVTAACFVFYRAQGSTTVGVLVMNMFWCLYNMIILAASVLVAVDRPQLRKETRVPCLLPASVSWAIEGASTETQAATLDLSEGGTHLLCRGPLPVGIDLRVQIGAGTEVVVLDAELVRAGEQTSEGLFGAALRFKSPDVQQRHQLIRLMYTDPQRWTEQPEVDAGWVSFYRLASSSFRWMRHRERPTLRRTHRVTIDRPAILEVGEKRFIMKLVNLSQGGAMIAGEVRDVRRGASVRLLVQLQSGDPVALPCRVLRTRRQGVVVAFDQVTAQQTTRLIWDLYVIPQTSDRRLAS